MNILMNDMEMRSDINLKGHNGHLIHDVDRIVTTLRVGKLGHVIPNSVPARTTLPSTSKDQIRMDWMGKWSLTSTSIMNSLTLATESSLHRMFLQCKKQSMTLRLKFLWPTKAPGEVA